MTDIDLDELATRLGDVRVIDVRSAGEYDGTRGYPGDPRQGHIPGAEHLDVRELMAMDADEIRARLGDPQELVVYCHSGQRSAYAADILRAVGYEARNYVGSWHEWSRTELPIEA
ncbi:MAG TPA: rhodanese-like domain-containing protein [Gaiellaceae bacterium]